MNRKYLRVQFIGYAVSTHPATVSPTPPEQGGGQGLYKQYQGDADDRRDRERRLDLVGYALERADRLFSREPNVLRIFVMPEFFFRGRYGAYAGPEAEADLARGLGALLSGCSNIDLAVWGTSLLACTGLDSAPAEVRARERLGDDYLAVYRACREYRDLSGIITPSLKGIMFHLDVLEAMDAAEREAEIAKGLDPLARTLMEMLAGCDLAPNLQVRNLCQVHGRDGSYFSVLKQYKSKVDFVFNATGGNFETAAGSDPERRPGAYLQTISAYPPIEPSPDEWKRTPTDPYCLFEYAGVNLGVEVCLDHIRCRLSRAATANRPDLQIIPSCGVEVTGTGVAARSGGLVFNCDGDYVLDNAQNGDNAHTQLFRVLEPGAPGNPARLSELIRPVETIKIERDVRSLYPHGAGELHVYAPEKF